jgi:mycothiol synthase
MTQALRERTEDRALPPGYTVRPAALADLEATVAMLNAASQASSGLNEHTVADWARDWQSPSFDLAERTRLVLDPSGAVVGYAIVLGSAPFTDLEQWGRTHPAHEGRGLGTHLASWSEKVCRQLATRAPAGEKVALQTWANLRETGAAALLADQGYHLERHFLRMAIEFDAPPPAPVWPAGIGVRTFVPGQDDEALYRTIHAAFGDSWGHVERPFEEGFKEWQHRYQSDETFDPSLWFMATAGSGGTEQLIGTAFCRWEMPEDAERAWIKTVGVRPEYRRRGIAEALLRQCFVALYARGRRKAALGVDAASPTGATRLYEKGGMRSVEERQEALWEKVLVQGNEGNGGNEGN